MSKTKSFFKYLKNISNLINSLLEKNLNKLNLKNFNHLFKNNKIILTFVALFVIFTSYLLVPTFYKQDDISKKLQIEFQKKFNLNLKFSENIKYNLFPTPHFNVIGSSIFKDQIEISKIKKLKIFISVNDLFSLKNIKVKDLIFENANFRLNKKNYNFFIKLINKDFKNGDLIIKNSNIFFENSEEEVLFINKILKIRYFYEPKELKNILYSENEIFNIPFSIKTFFNEDKNKIFSTINFNLMKIKIFNELSLENEKKTGKTELTFKKFKRIAKYQIKKNSFNFHIFDKINQPKISYRGNLNFKPFYASLEGNSDKINLNYLFASNAIIAQLLKTEIFNNKNIDFKMNITAENVRYNENIKNIILESKIQDGLIDVDKTKFSWKNFVDFELIESLIYVRDGELVLDGKLKINVNDYNSLYKYLLTPKKYRNKIEQIDLNFTYNFDQKIAELKDIKVDNIINQNINKILNSVILKKEKLQNKIYFKNLLNQAIKSYAG